MGNSNKLYFQFAVENVRKTLDAQKGEIEKWARENPILLDVRFKNLKSQLEQIRSIFGDSSQLTSLGNQIDSTFEKARKGAKRMRQSVDEASEAMQRLKKASGYENSVNEALKSNASAIARTKREIEELNREIETHKKLISQGVVVKGDPNILKDSLAIKQRELAELEQKLTGLQSRRLELEQKLSTATQDRVKAQKDVATAQVQSEREVANTINGTTIALRNQSQILSDLKSMAMQYISVWGAQNFIHNIIETGGLLEQQRLSIGAILQNAGQATELFGQIKQLALKSPFGVVELDKMSKQLTAYGFEYKELYNWTKRLADISAATGTSVDRLALALGHVRAEGALSGYTLRQFAMGNVPMLRMLAENLNISTKQVREKVRKKDISYEDVMKVMQQLTDKGGMFYEAQETMSQALNAKFKNLRDAFDIMYNEIAESSVGDKLKDLAGILTAGAKHWKELADVIKWTGGAFLVAKGAMMLYNQAIGAGTAATLKSAAADKQKEVNMLRLARQYRTLSAFEKELLATHAGWFYTSGKVTQAQLTELLTEKKLGQEELYRSVALGKINKELALKAILEMKAGTAAERHAKAELLWGIRSVQTLSKWRVGWLMVGNAIRTAGAALWSFTKIALPMAAFSAIVELFARTSQMREQAEEMSADLAEKATSDMKVLNETFKELQSNDYFKSSEKNGKYINGRRVIQLGIKFNEEELQKADLSGEIESLKNKLQDLSPMYEGDLIDINKMNDQVEQFKMIVRKMESIRHANDVTEAMSNVVMDANVDVAGKNWFTRMFGDTYTTDIKDYEDKLNDVTKQVNEINEQTIDKIDAELGGRLTKLQKKYSLDSKNAALVKVFEEWSKNGVDRNINPTGLAKTTFDDIARGGMRSLRDQFEQLKADTKEMAETMSSIVVNQFKDDPDGAIYAITTYMKKLMAAASVTDPRVMDEAMRLMLDEMRKYLPQNLQAGVLEQMQVKILQEQFASLLGNSITETSSEDEIKKAYESAKKGADSWGEMMGYDMKRLGEKAGQAYDDALQAKLNSVKLKTDWQKRASQVFVQNVSIKSNFDKSLDEFAQAVQKDLKEKQDYLKRNKAHLKMTLNIDTDILMNVDKLKALMDKLALEGQKKAAQGDWEGAQALYSKIDNELKPYYNALVAVEEDKTWLKKEGYPEKDQTKGKNGSQEDKEAKKLRERVRILKEAADSYQYWRQKVGDAAAESRMQGEFGQLLKEQNLEIKNADELRSKLQQLREEYSKKPQTKAMVEAIKEIDKELAQLDRKDFEKTTEEFASKVQIELDSLTRAWEIFNNVREATGNVELAVQISGVDYANGKNRNLADALRKKLEQDFITFGGGIKFDIGLSDDEIEKQIQAAMPEQSQEAIKGLVAEYKKWRDLQRDVLRKDVDVFSKLIGSSVDYQSEIQKINDKYKEQLESLQALRDLGEGNEDENGNKGISNKQYERAKEILDTTTDQERWTKETTYITLMNNSLAMTRDEIMAAADVQENLLNRRLLAGLMTAQQYEEEMAKLKKIMSDWNTSGFLGSRSAAGAFLSGGNQGLLDYYQRRASKARSEYARSENQESPEAQEKLQEAEHYDKLYTALAKLTDKAEDVVGAFRTLQGGVDLLGNLFESIGWEGGSNAMSDVGGLLSGALGGASSLSALGPWGMAAGAGLGLVSGLFALHDKELQRQIDAIKENNDALEANTNAIKTARDRTLGYDTGQLRSKFSSLHNNLIAYHDIDLGFTQLENVPMWDEASAAMREYYKKNGSGSGYMQELENLKAEREDYLKMYNLETDKKKVSQEALNEYKEKIAELDDQITYFVEDLAKELWGIDFQSWADQISDALWTAFENGEDAVEAFHDTAKDIMADVAQRMMNLHFIEPAFQELEDTLFGKINTNTGLREGGVAYNSATGELDEYAVLKILGEYLGEGGYMEKQIEGAQKFYELAQKASGFDFSSDENSSSTGSSIKSITEQTADLLSSYVNSIRADVSVNRAMIADYFPMYYAAMTQGNASLRNLEEQARLTAQNTDAIKHSNQAILDRIDGLKNRAWKVPVA